MAEFSIFWTTGTTGDGTNPYTEGQLFSWLRRTFNSDNASQGPLKTYQGELAVTATSGAVNVATGAAYVYGIPYENDAVVSVPIPTPLSATRIDRIVLRANWTAKTVRIARLAGTEGGAAPPLTQTPGSVYEISLAQVSITTGGVITVTDERQFCRFATEIAAENIAGGAVGTSMIADGAVTTAKLAEGAVTTTKIADGTALAEILDDDGAGSGLDADLLDGQHGDYYAQASKLSDFMQSNNVESTVGQTISLSGVWTNVNGLSLSVTLVGTCRLLIFTTISRYDTGSGGFSTVRTRAVVDGAPLAEIRGALRDQGSTSAQWKADVAAGNHTVTVQIYIDAGTPLTLQTRELAVIVIPS